MKKKLFFPEDCVMIGNKPVGSYYRAVMRLLEKYSRITIIYNKSSSAFSRQREQEMLDKLLEFVNASKKFSKEEKISLKSHLSELKYSIMLSREDKAKEIIHYLSSVGVEVLEAKDFPHTEDGVKYYNMKVILEKHPALKAILLKQEKE